MVLAVVAFFFFFNDTATTEIYTLSLHDALPIFEVDCWRKMRKFDLSLRSSRSSYFATFRHQLTILSKADALDEEQWLNMLGTFVKDWLRCQSHFVHGRDSLVDILKERGLLSESDAVQPLIGKKSRVKLLNNPFVSRPLWPLLSSFRLLPFWI